MDLTQEVTRARMQRLIDPDDPAEAAQARSMPRIAGPIGLDETHRRVSGGLEAPARQAFSNNLPGAAGGKSEHIVALARCVAEGSAP